MIHLPQICQRVFLLAMLAGTTTAHAAGLTDTGISTCYNDTVADSVTASNAASIARDAGTHPRQDCRFGRDPATTAGAAKTGAGAKGLDYTKIANNGTALGAGVALGSNPTDWACTQDNITGLTWEVKTTSGLSSSTSQYTWYSQNTSTNGGVAGTSTSTFGSCTGITGCDTEKFAADVNAVQLCSFSDWRLPSLRELMTLVLLDGTTPAIDPTYFLNTNSPYYLSTTTYATNPSLAWSIDFSSGQPYPVSKSVLNYVRLVRGTPF